MLDGFEVKKVDNTYEVTVTISECDSYRPRTLRERLARVIRNIERMEAYKYGSK